MITVQLLGGACLRSGDTALSGPPAQRHRVALLTLIVAAWPQPLSRDRAMALLWPERDVANARRLLNLAVHVLRSALGEGAIASTGDGLLFNPTGVSCDLHDLRTAIAAGVCERVVQLYAGVLLDGFHLSESVEFGYWLDERRSELLHAYVGALLALAKCQEESGDVHSRVRTCLKLVASDPYSGKHAEALMRALDAAGDRAGAIQHAREHAQRVRADLGLDPDESVTALARQLRDARVRRLPSSVAVLPFLDLSADQEQEHLADGITEDVIAHLAKIRGLSVISSRSVMRFKERQRSLKEIGSILGATTVLDGSVRRVGDRVRVVAKLSEVATDKHLWADTYDRFLTDIFSVQTDVALQIAGSLKAELSPDEQTRVRMQPTRDIRAYQLYLEGRRCLIEYSLDAIRRSIEFFERAIARDSSFALAYTQLAMAYVELAEDGTTAPDAAYGRATAAAATALELDPLLGAAHCTMGHLKMVRELDWPGAEESFKRALELSPSDADTYCLYGRFCAGLARHQEAIALHRRAHELDPLAHRMDFVTAFLRAGRYREAIAEAESAMALDPRHARTRATLGWAYFLSGRRDEGLAQLSEAVSLTRNNSMWLAQLGEAYGLAGDTEKARQILAELEALARNAYISPYHFAYVHIGLGDFDRAMDLLEQAVALRTGPAYGIKGSFLLAPLRDHPRFRSLLHRMKLTSHATVRP